MQLIFLVVNECAQCEDFFCSEPTSLSVPCYALTCKVNMVATLRAVYVAAIICDSLIGSSCSFDWQPATLSDYVQCTH